MPCEYFLLIRRQRRPCLLAIDDGLSLAGQHAGRAATIYSNILIYYQYSMMTLIYWNVEGSVSKYVRCRGRQQSYHWGQVSVETGARGLTALSSTK